MKEYLCYGGGQIKGSHLIVTFLSFMKVAKMSVFTKKLNFITGEYEWVIHDEDYDFHQEIARSAFADMLHDKERNDKYYLGLKSAIEEMHKAGKKAKVLDIGTGTGLLSMMAAQLDADSIVACEAFPPIAECARKVIAKNGFANKIHVVKKRSTEMTVGPNGDMAERANILVTEVFDTELIGEGAIATFSHAHRELLEKDCLVVPNSATIYAQVIESDPIQRWNKLTPVDCGNTSLTVPDSIMSCPGAAAVHDVQINQLNISDFREIIPPQPVFRFDWSGKTPILNNHCTMHVAKALCTGTAQAVFMWWELSMDVANKVKLSCAPWWAHPSKPPGPDKIPWRDHWMQAIYYVPTPLQVRQNEELLLISCHDEFSLWFNISKKLELKDSYREPPVCTCGLHAFNSRTRIGMLNDNKRRSVYLKAMKNVVNSDSVILSLGDCSLIGLQAAGLGAKKVYCVEENKLCRRVIEEFVSHNKFNEIVSVLPCISSLSNQAREKIDIIIGEPYFQSSILPWDILRWWYILQKFQNVKKVMPVAVTLWGLPVQFEHLYKIRAPLNYVSGFAMFDFDELIQSSSDISDSRVEAQPLWEYPGVALSEPVRIHEFSLAQQLPSSDETVKGNAQYKIEGICHGVVLWLDIHFDESNTVSCGPQLPIQVGKPIMWDMYSRQGVYFMEQKTTVTSVDKLGYTFTFKPSSMEFICSFSVHKK